MCEGVKDHNKYRITVKQGDKIKIGNPIITFKK